MLRLMSCPQGHFWESALPDAPLSCPVCSAPAESLPLLDLAPSEPPLIDPRIAGHPPVAHAPGSPGPAEPLPLFDGGRHPVITGYQVLQELGRSPTAVRLYRARQQVTGRPVLLKVVVAREDASQRAWNSLRGEASALGKLSHPNIVPIYEAGERDRQLFYNATGLVEGPTLAQKVAEKPLPPGQVIRLMLLLTGAIEHAHAQGVLHRNLKPASVLLQQVTTRASRVSPPRDPSGATAHPGADCMLHTDCYIPRLTDFGLARKPVEGDAVDVELYGEQAGYLSPEQAWGRVKEIGPTTDVYGLGSILYFLLTGRPPFRGPTLPDILDAIQTANLVAPSRSRRVSGDLEAICKRCLARLPRRRYPSAGALGEDLRRAALGLPVEARPCSVAGQCLRWVRRRPAAAGLVFVSVLAVLGLFTGYVVGRADNDASTGAVQALRAQLATLEQQHERAQQQLKALQTLVQVTAHRQRLEEAQRELVRGNPGRARALLEQSWASERGLEWHYLFARTLGRGKAEVKEAERHGGRSLRGVCGVAFNPTDGRYLVIAVNASDGAQVRLWHVPTTRTQVLQRPGFRGPVHAVAIRPDGQQLAVVGGDADDTGGEMRLFSLQEGPPRGKLLLTIPVPGERLTDVAYMEDGDRLIVAQGGGRLALVRSETGVLERWSMGTEAALPGVQRGRTTRLALSPDGGQFLSFTENATAAQGWVPQMLTPGQVFPGMAAVTAVALARDGRVAVARADSTVLIQDSHREVSTLPALPRPARRLAFSPDGQRLAVACEDDTVRLWAEAGTTWVELLTLPAKGSVGLAFSPSGHTLVTAGPDQVTAWGATN